MDTSEETPLFTRSVDYDACSSSATDSQSIFHVKRPIYQAEDLHKLSAYDYQHGSFTSSFKRFCSSCQLKACLLKTVPILEWLPSYNWKKDIMGDIASGITVAIMNIPQGMAYGILGNLPPIVGIYMAFFPVLVYCIFGTSRHASMGTVAIVSLMVGKTVSHYSTEIDSGGINSTALINNTNSDVHYTNVQVATTVTFAVAITQIIMYILRLGIITALLSETLVSAFTCASAFYIVTSQIKDLFGLVLPKRKGLFTLPSTLYDVYTELPNANIAAVIISIAFVCVMTINNELFKPRLAKKTKIPFPIELVAVLIGTAISNGYNMNENFGVAIVGNIPTGLPDPTIPEFSLLPSIMSDAIIITMVSYTTTMSMALIVAQKGQYEIDANQELFALSWSNCVGSFFSCMPITASLSRTIIQQAVGGVTQLTSVVSCLLLLNILLWIGPLFENLPRCVLASIILVALKSMLLQFTSLPRYWKLSKWDGLVWSITFFTTAIISIDYGLFSGIIISLLCIFIQGQNPNTCLLGVMPDTDIYLDTKHYKGVQEIRGVKIFHYNGSLNFASKSTFKKELFNKTGLDPLAMITKNKIKIKTSKRVSDKESVKNKSAVALVLDFSALSNIDPSGVDALWTLINLYEQVHVQVYLCSCSGPVFETLKRCNRHYKRNAKFTIFATIHDAVLFAQSHIQNTENNVDCI